MDSAEHPGAEEGQLLDRPLETLELLTAPAALVVDDRVMILLT
jgi:hypothetical protein